jgi:hypothetical protein
VGYLFPIYREASAYAHLLEEVINGDPEETKPEELCDRAWEIVGPRLADARREAAARHRQLAGSDPTSSDPAEVVPAAYHGRVDTLFVAKGLRRWGYVEPKTVAACADAACVHDEPARRRRPAGLRRGADLPDWRAAPCTRSIRGRCRSVGRWPPSFATEQPATLLPVFTAPVPARWPTRCPAHRAPTPVGSPLDIPGSW